MLLAGVSYNEEEHVALCQRVEAALVREREMLAEQGALGNQIKDMETRVAVREKIEQELEGLESRLMNLQMLKGLFRGNDFVKFVSSIYLQNLCNAANERFYRMTRQRLKLELSEENDFVVRDFMNEGRVRSARTLSGGQVFQASLSLALALTGVVECCLRNLEIRAGREPGGRADLSCRGNAAGGSGMFVRGEHGGEGKRGNKR